MANENQTGIINYDAYCMSNREKLIYFGLAGVFVWIVSFVFYQNIFISLLLTPMGLIYLPVKRKEIIKKRREELNMQFKEMLYSVSSSLGAGRSIESAFIDAIKDLSISYPEGDAYIIKELECIKRRLTLNETIESALEDLANRSKIEDIKSFVDVFKTCKRTGGNLVQVIRNTSDIIGDKISTRQEIDTILAQRKFEQKVLNVLPIVMIFILSSTSPEFMEPIFNSIAGRATMTVSVILLGIAYFISKKVMDIEV